jgi:serine/threonine protein kinase
MGTVYYLSPILRDAYGKSDPNVKHNAYKSDVYSLGMTLLVMSCLEFPQVLTSIGGEAGLFQVINGLNYSNDLKGLLQWMLTHDEADRPTFKEINNWLNPVAGHPLQAPASDISPQMDAVAAAREDPPLLQAVPEEVPPIPAGPQAADRALEGVRPQHPARMPNDPVCESCLCSRCMLF